MIRSVQNLNLANINFGSKKRVDRLKSANNAASQAENATQNPKQNTNQFYYPNCLESYNAASVGIAPIPQRKFPEQKRGLMNAVSGGLSSSYEVSKANSYAKAYNRVFPAYSIVKDFRQQIGIIAPIRDISAQNFCAAMKNFSKYQDYLENANPIYMQKFTRSISAPSFFGPNSRVYFRQQQKMLPYGREVFLVNVPESLAVNQRNDMSGKFISASDVYDFDNAVSSHNIKATDDGGLFVQQINIIEPSMCNMAFGRFANLLNMPATINNAKISPNGDFQADSMVTYDYDNDGFLIGTKTYIHPTVIYGGADKHNSYNLREFLLTADYAFGTVYDPRDPGDRAFLTSVKENYENDELYIQANSALIPLQNGLHVNYGNYSTDGNRIWYNRKNYLNLDGIK